MFLFKFSRLFCGGDDGDNYDDMIHYMYHVRNTMCMYSSKNLIGYTNNFFFSFYQLLLSPTAPEREHITTTGNIITHTPSIK